MSRNPQALGGTAQRQPRGVSRWQIVLRGLTLRCPNCGGRGVFRGLFGVNERCPSCDFLIQREEGFFLGAMALNYAAAAFPLVPVFVLVFMERISVPLALAIIVGWGVIVPIAFYNLSRSLWMMLVYLTVPQRLPANQTDAERAQGEHF